MSLTLSIGVVGAAGRGSAFAGSLAALGARVSAVCDVHAPELERARRELAAEHAFTDFEQMLDQARPDAVIVATPMQLHVPMAIAALERSIHVLSEVTAGISLTECRELVAASRRSSATYMLAENYCYTRPNVFVRELVRRGWFGEPHYAEGEYLHDVRELAETTPWRLHWQLGIAGITYGTHSLGPILQWLSGDRVVRVSCESGGAHHRDPRGQPYANDGAVMLCKTAQGRLIKIRVDLVSERPHAMTNYSLQGTDGAYESSRAEDDSGRIWLRAHSPVVRWSDVNALLSDPALAGVLPERWQSPPSAALQAGHGGGDYFVLEDFLRTCRGEIACPIGIHEAMDMTLPGLVSQQSIAERGAWLEVPDSRHWEGVPARPQLQMILGEGAIARPPVPPLDPEYGIRPMTDFDAPGILAVLKKSGLVTWDEGKLADVRAKGLAEGVFVAVHRASGSVVACAMASHAPIAGHPNAGAVDWVAADPDHAGHGLGAAVTARAVQRLVSAGYRRIYLCTDDFRLAAIRSYLKLGFEPHLFTDPMRERWAAVSRDLERSGKG